MMARVSMKIEPRTSKTGPSPRKPSFAVLRSLVDARETALDADHVIMFVGTHCPSATLNPRHTAPQKRAVYADEAL